CVQTIAFPLTF
nr:immunoglobulin light chain junction region [Macaca mulatta]MOW10789.1 immunoglobulin light chain junction region [Macaca mulatta]MOW43137.1 immunoglobulin light chain junction region [Macaca mulatta]